MTASDRYHRQMLLEGVGEEGQARLGAARALIVGCGALGCVQADLLARAGVGRITLIDRDVVEITNLQRQVLFTEADAAEGLPKAEAAARRLRAVNSRIQIDAVIADFAHTNAERLAGVSPADTEDDEPDDEPLEEESSAARSAGNASRGESAPADVILDGTDNFETRYLINDLAVRHGIPYIYGGAVGTTGMAMTIIPGRTPCLRCLFETMPPPGSSPTCDTAGVFGPVIAITAGYQASEALKILLGRGGECGGSLLQLDLWTNERRRLDVSSLRDTADCPCCKRGEFPYLSGELAPRAVRMCGRGAVQIYPTGEGRIDLEDLATRLAPHGRFRTNQFLLRGELAAERGDGGEPIELTVFADGRTLVRGTTRTEAARSVHAKYIGS